MEFFETSEDVDRHIVRTRAELQALEGDVASSVAMGRLSASYPYHPVLIGRMLFLLLSAMCFFVVVVVLALPFLDGVVDSEVIGTIHRIETGMGIPLPVAIGAGALLLFLAWVALSQAAVAIGRDAPLTLPEEKNRDRLATELSRLTRQRQMMERAMAGTPRPSTVRYDPPPQAPEVHPSASAYERPPPAPSYLGAPRPDLPSMPPGHDPARSHNTAPAPPAAHPRATRPHRPASRDTPPGSYARFRTPAAVAREALPPSGRSGLHHSDRPTPSYISDGGYVSGSGAASHHDIETPTDQYADMPSDAHPASPGVLAEPPAPQGMNSLIEYTDEVVNHDGDGPSYVVETDPSLSAAAFGRPVATHLPAFDIQEDWLAEVIHKAEILADSFPIQARLEFNVANALPFTLVLERATPAMAVRAMMAYVEFLATIPLPRLGRVELRSVAHLDRNFHRNVRSACEPYFGDNVTIDHQLGLVELTFAAPDSRWDRYPYLPTA